MLIYFALALMLWRPYSTGDSSTTTPPPTPVPIAPSVAITTEGTAMKGKGFATPVSMAPATVEGEKGACYYVTYRYTFADGAFDAGPIYWPLCFAQEDDPFANKSAWKLQGPPLGWTPSPSMLKVIDHHRFLRHFFPDRYLNSASPAPSPKS